MEAGAPTAYFYDEITEGKLRIHEAKGGTSEAQQTWECLCLWIALVIWNSKWQRRRVALTIKSDNTSALAFASILKVASDSNLIGR